MKTLSLKQPFAELVVSGKKTIELRKWNTHFRGPFLIHASLSPDMENMKKFGFKELPLGKIVGRAEITGVKKYEDTDGLKEDKEMHLAEGDWGNYGFLLKNAEKIDPIDAKGSLNFWDFKGEIKE